MVTYEPEPNLQHCRSSNFTDAVASSWTVEGLFHKGPPPVKKTTLVYWTSSGQGWVCHPAWGEELRWELSQKETLAEPWMQLLARCQRAGSGRGKRGGRGLWAALCGGVSPPMTEEHCILWEGASKAKRRNPQPSSYTKGPLEVRGLEACQRFICRRQFEF